MQLPSRIAAAALLASAACATLTPEAKAIKVVQETDIAKTCVFLQRIDAGYVPRSAASSLEVDDNKRDALNRAAAMGATHVVWNERTGATPDRVLLSGAAYRCSDAK